MDWYDPSEEMERLRRQINRFFERFGAFPAGRELMLSGKNLLSFREPLADIQDRGDNIIVTIELPGVRKEDIELSVTEDDITVRVERKRHAAEKGEGFYRIERSYRGFYRSMRLPSKVMPEGAEASYKDGVLEIKLPKKEKSRKAKKITIK